MNGSKAIAVVDFAHLATALTDFNTFSAQFGLPQEPSTNPMATTNTVFQVVFQHPGITPQVDPGWNGEEALDIEWAHSIAPSAKIYLVESDDGNLPATAAIAAALPGVKEVSMSFGFPNESLGASELQLDSNFLHQGVVFLASSGDAGGVPNWPSESPNVISVGGTSLFMNGAGTSVIDEIGWSDSGGGPSAFELRPEFQAVLGNKIGTHRADPDIAAIADPNTGVPIFTTSPLPADFGTGPWYQIGGTSLACPVVAGIINTTGTFLASSRAEDDLIYKLLGTSKIRDITFGTAGSFSAGPGWDFVTGVGAPLNLSSSELAFPTTGQLTATPNGTVSYAFAASDPLSPSGSITGTLANGPSWVAWNGSTLTLSPPAGTRTGDYPITLSATESGSPPTTVTQTFLILVAPVSLKSGSLSSTTVVGGNSTTLTVNLTGPAPSGGVTVGITSGLTPAAAQTTVTIPEGSSTGQVQIATHPVSKSTQGYVNLQYGTVSVQVPLRILP